MSEAGTGLRQDGFKVKNPKGDVRFCWEVIDLAADALKYMIEPLKPKVIIGVGRGGFVPAVLLSHRLRIPMHTIIASTYTGTRRTADERTHLEIPEPLRKLVPHGENAVIVDDVIDTASTYNEVKKHFPEAIYAVIVNKRPILPALHFCHVPLGVWVKFPWEV